MRDMYHVLRTLPLDDTEATLEAVAQHVVKDGFSSAAIIFLESMKPLGFLTGQATICAIPVLGSFVEPMRLERYASLFSDRLFIERLIRRIEELDTAQAGVSNTQKE